MRFQIVEMSLRSRVFVGWKKNGVVPKSFRFKLGNRHLKNSHMYKKYQIRLLEEEIKSKPWKMIHRGLRKNYKEHFLF